MFFIIFVYEKSNAGEESRRQEGGRPKDHRLKREIFYFRLILHSIFLSRIFDKIYYGL